MSFKTDFLRRADASEGVWGKYFENEQREAIVWTGKVLFTPCKAIGVRPSVDLKHMGE
jgi:hypothetical protein